MSIKDMMNHEISEKMNLQDLLKRVGVLSFYLAVIIEVTLVILDKSEFLYPYEGWTFRITFLLCLIKVLFTKYDRKEYFTIALFLGLGFISYRVTGRNEILRIVMFVVACKDVDMIRCLKMVFWMTLTGCAVIILLSITGIYGALTLTQDFGRGGVETRYVLGMGHPNSLQCMVLMISALGIYLYHVKWKWFHYMMVWLINLLFFVMTDSKTAMAIVTVMVVLFLIADRLHAKGIKKLFSMMNIAAVVGSIGLSIFAAKDAMSLFEYYWGAPLTRKVEIYLFLDKLLTGRIHSLVDTTYKEGTISTWSLFSSPHNTYYFDMGWVRLFYWYGVIPGAIIVACMLFLLGYFYKNDKLSELILFSTYSVYTIVEAHLISVYIGRNYLLFIAGMFIWKIWSKTRKQDESN